MLGYVCKYTPMESLKLWHTEITTTGTICHGFYDVRTPMHANILFLYQGRAGRCDGT